MPFGYTLLDPLVVLLGTALALYFLGTRPVRLITWLPAMLTLYFFIPFLTLLTLWQTVPLVLVGRALLKGQIRADSSVQLFLLFLLAAFFASASYGLLLGHDAARTVIRILYYAGIFAILSFTYEMAARREDTYELFLKGLVGLGIVLAVYGLYQVVAVYTGLPFRGILRGTGGAQAAFEGGFFRINSLATEPKRLGYVMFVCALACLFLARLRPERALRLKWTGVGILFMSLFTFAGSYFAAILLFVVTAPILFPSRATKYVIGVGVLLTAALTLFPDLPLFEAIQQGIERRTAEVEVGLDGRVYRQEFYAQDYLANHPMAKLFGVGLGQYYRTFANTYGIGAGISEYGGLLPLNSNFLELVFDFGGIVATMFYIAIGLLILALRRRGETFLCLALLFLTLQSLTILTLHFMVLFAGIATGRLALARRLRRQQALAAASSTEAPTGLQVS